MWRRVFPHPYLTLVLVMVWLLLVNRMNLGSLIFAVILATAVAGFTSAYWMRRPKVANPLWLVQYVLIVVWDIVRSNVTVARQVLFTPNDRLRPAWVTIPLDIKTPEAITMLAGSITMTPGTLTADMSGCGRALLVHCLHAPDPDAVRNEIKTRYEARLKRIFE